MTDVFQGDPPVSDEKSSEVVTVTVELPSDEMVVGKKYDLNFSLGEFDKESIFALALDANPGLTILSVREIEIQSDKLKNYQIAGDGSWVKILSLPAGEQKQASIQENARLFTLQVKVTRQVEDGTPLFQLKKNFDHIYTTFHKASDQMYPIALDFVSSTSLPFQELQSTVFPNPIVNSLTLHWETNQTGNATLEIVDVSGRIQVRESLPVSGHKLTYTGVVLARLKAGTYILRMTLPDGKILTHQVIKR